MEKNGMATNSKENEHFKGVDRVDRGGGHSTRDNEKPTGKSSGFAPNPNDDSHKPKIVPWK